MNISGHKDFYNKWKDVIGEYTYCYRLFEEKAKKAFGSVFDVIDDIMYNIIKTDYQKCLCLLLLQTEKTLEKLNDSFYDKKGNFIDDYSVIRYKELEKYILDLGGVPFIVKSFTFTQYNKEIEMLEQEFKKKIVKLKQEQYRLYLENQFLDSHREDIRQMIRDIIKEEQEQKK